MVFPQRAVKYKSVPAFIPKADELSRISRDLRFHPSSVTDPRTLTREQIATFNREGYLKPLRIFDGSEIATIRAYFDHLLSQTLAAGGNSYSISTAHLRLRVMSMTFLTDGRIVGVRPGPAGRRSGSPGDRISSARCPATVSVSPGTRMPVTGR